jgi:hypothetical protein
MYAGAVLKSPTDFSNYEDWEKYVLDTVAPDEVASTLAFGRTRRFLRFYELREQVFPAEFTEELERLQTLSGPERTAELGILNGRIFAHMTSFLMEAAAAVDDTVAKETPRQEAERLLEYIGKTNPWFALWLAFKSRPIGSDARTWIEYAGQMLKDSSPNDLEFALLMPQLGELLHQFRDSNRPLPKLYFQRIWFLHFYRSEKSTERNLQARAIVQGLLEAIESCTYA